MQDCCQDKQHMLVPNQLQHLGKVLAGLPSMEATISKLLYSSARESSVHQTLVRGT